MKTKATVYDFKAVKAKHRPTMPYKITLYIGQTMYRKNLLFLTLLSWFSSFISMDRSSGLLEGGGGTRG